MDHINLYEHFEWDQKELRQVRGPYIQGRPPGTTRFIFGTLPSNAFAACQRTPRSFKLAGEKRWKAVGSSNFWNSSASIENSATAGLKSLATTAGARNALASSVTAMALQSYSVNNLLVEDRCHLAVRPKLPFELAPSANLYWLWRSSTMFVLLKAYARPLTRACTSSVTTQKLSSASCTMISRTNCS